MHKEDHKRRGTIAARPTTLGTMVRALPLVAVACPAALDVLVAPAAEPLPVALPLAPPDVACEPTAPFWPKVGSGTLLDTSQAPLVYAGHGGGVADGL